MSDRDEETPAARAAIDGVAVEPLRDELVEDVAGGGGTSMCSMMMCSQVDEN